MAKIRLSSNVAWFRCPGCDETHRFALSSWKDAEGNQHEGWSMTGDVDRPTFMPSLVTWWEEEQAGKKVERRCHLNVEHGRITFHSDCTHALAGQTVDMLDWIDRIS